jgi:hypothetical protein
MPIANREEKAKVSSSMWQMSILLTVTRYKKRRSFRNKNDSISEA